MLHHLGHKSLCWSSLTIMPSFISISSHVYFRSIQAICWEWFLKVKFCKLSNVLMISIETVSLRKNKRIPTIKLLKYWKPLSITKLVLIDMKITINGLKNLWMSKFRSTTKQNQIPSYGLEDHISNQHAMLLVLKFSLFYECWIFGIYPDKVCNLVTY